MPGNGSGFHAGQGFPNLGAGFFGDARPYGPAGKGRGQEVFHRQGHFLVKIQVLGHVPRPQMGDVPPLAVQVMDAAPMRQLSQQGANQRGFPCAVLSDQGGKLSAVDVHGNVLEQGLPASHDGYVLQVNMA